MSHCDYCASLIDLEEPGWCYMIMEDESLIYAHEECIEVSENVILHPVYFDTK